METTCDQNPDSPYGIYCEEHGEQGLTKENYTKQMNNPDALWKCPICGMSAWWDDDRYEKSFSDGEE